MRSRGVSSIRDLRGFNDGDSSSSSSGSSSVGGCMNASARVGGAGLDERWLT